MGRESTQQTTPDLFSTDQVRENFAAPIKSGSDRARTRTVRCFMLFLAILPTTSNAQNEKNGAYFCTEEASGGLRFDKSLKEWKGVAFTARRKFVLRLKFIRSVVEKGEASQGGEAFSAYEVTVTDQGSDHVRKCESRRDDKQVWAGNLNLLFCDVGLRGYKFNLDRNRYLETYAIGFADPESDEVSDTPYISGGSCTKIE